MCTRHDLRWTSIRTRKRPRSCGASFDISLADLAPDLRPEQKIGSVGSDLELRAFSERQSVGARHAEVGGVLGLTSADLLAGCNLGGLAGGTRDGAGHYDLRAGSA